MNTMTILEKAANRLVSKVRIRNLYPDSTKIRNELFAMVDLLKNMGFEVDLTWSENLDENKIITISLSLDGNEINKKA